MKKKIKFVETTSNGKDVYTADVYCDKCGKLFSKSGEGAITKKMFDIEDICFSCIRKHAEEVGFI